MHSTRLLSDPSIFKFSGSTHTRYLPTELLSNSIPGGDPKSFNNERSNYSQTPYFYPIGGSGKEEGTIKNEDANERLKDITEITLYGEFGKSRFIKMKNPDDIYAYPLRPGI